MADKPIEAKLSYSRAFAVWTAAGADPFLRANVLREYATALMITEEFEEALAQVDHALRIAKTGEQGFVNHDLAAEMSVGQEKTARDQLRGAIEQLLLLQSKICSSLQRFSAARDT